MPKPPTQNITKPRSAPSARTKQAENKHLLDVRGIECDTSTETAIADQHQSQASTDQSGSSPIHASIAGHSKSVRSDLPRTSRSLSDAQSNVPGYMMTTRSTSLRTVALSASSTIVSRRGAPEPRSSSRTSGDGTPPVVGVHPDATSHTIAPALPISRAHRTLASHAVLRGVVPPPRATTPTSSTQPRRTLAAKETARPSSQPTLSSKPTTPIRCASEQSSANTAHHTSSPSSMARARKSMPANTSEQASRPNMTRQPADSGTPVPKPSSSLRNEGATKRTTIMSMRTTQRSGPSNASIPGGTTSTIAQRPTARPTLSASSHNTGLEPVIAGRRATHSVISGVEANATHRPVNASTQISRSNPYSTPLSTRSLPNQATSVLADLSSASVKEASMQGRPSHLPSMGFFSKDSEFRAGGDIMSGNNSQQGNVNINAKNINIHHGSPTDEHKTAVSHISDKLRSYIVDDAMLSKETHGEPPVCYEGTRGHLLEHTLSWVAAASPGRSEEGNISRRAKCIVGAPGAGKSTIMNTLIVGLLSQAASRSPGLIAAHYCISTAGSKILPTITLQLARHSAGVAERVSQLLRPALHTGVIPMQTLEHLFLEAVITYHHTVFVIIDALDEASQPADLATMISRVIHSSPPNLRLLLATRNEHGILQSLGAALISKIVHEIPTEKSMAEVEGYIMRRLRAGVKEFFGDDPAWSAWPDKSQLQRLSDNAAGLFIWARTAVDFILSRIKKQGTVKRDRLIEDVGRVGMADVNTLYMFILRESLPDDDIGDKDGMAIEGIKGVLGFIVAAEYPLTLDDIVGFLGYENFDALNFVRRTRSILVPGVDKITGATVPRVHKTFSDVLTSTRAEMFQIVVKDAHRSVASRCFELMNAQLCFNICGLRSSFALTEQLDEVVASVPKGLIYASTSWSYHLSSSQRNSRFPLLDRSYLPFIKTLLYEKFLFWLEIVSLSETQDHSAGWLEDLAYQLYEVSEVGLSVYAEHASVLIKRFSECIRASIPHIYISLLAFSPGDCVVAAHYREQSAATVIPHPSGMPSQGDSWDADPSMTGEDEVWPVSFSPCGRRLAAGYASHIVRVWDVDTEECEIALLKDSHSVRSVCFSPSGLLIASGSEDKTIRVWDTETGKCILGPLTGHTNSILSISFSPDSTRIASGSEDWTIRVWDVRTGDCVLGPLKGHTDGVNVVSYSPDGSCIASGSSDSTIQLRNAQTGVCICGPLEGPEGCIMSLSFHPDGYRLVSGSTDKTLRIWDIQKGTCIHEPLIGHDSKVLSVCFSPNGQHIASGSTDQTVRIWDAEAAVCVAGPFGGATDIVKSVAFSADGKYLAAGSWDGTVRLWDFNALLSAGLCDSARRDEASTTVGITDHTAVQKARGRYNDGDGSWMMGPNGEHLFFTPDFYDSAIWRPSTVRILGRPSIIKPDLSNLVSGEEWLGCFPSS